MPRKREYESDAARAKAYRERQAQETVRLDPQILARLMGAVEAAARAGDELAETVRTGTADGLLRNLCLHFERVGGAKPGLPESASDPKGGLV